MTKRFYSGSRDASSGGTSEAVRLKKIEIMKGGKLPLTPGERYKRILKKKMEEHRNQAQLASSGRPMSKKAEEALKEMAMKKAAKEEKALRQMIVIKPRSIPGAGRMDSKGRVYDLADNIVLKIDAKTAKIRSPGGMVLGKYKPKSFMSNMMVADWIKKYSPFFIRQRQMEMQRQLLEARMAEAAVSAGGVYGSSGNLVAVDLNGNVYMTQQGLQPTRDMYGNEIKDPYHAMEQQYQQQQMPDAFHQGPGVSVHGVVSNNVWGTHAENVWGGMADNVWGGTNSNIWGGVGGNPWGSGRGMKIWGSGKEGQRNYFKPVWTFFTTLLGFKGGKHKQRYAQLRAYRSAHRTTHRSAPVGRSGGRSR